MDSLLDRGIPYDDARHGHVTTYRHQPDAYRNLDPQIMAAPKVESLNPKSLSPARGFSHITRASGLVFLGGQIGSDETGRVVNPGDLPAQFDRAIQNVGTALSAAGCGPDQVVKLTYFVTDVTAYRNSLSTIGESYRAVFGKHYPASSLFEVKGLFEADAMIEIEAIAVEQSR